MEYTILGDTGLLLKCVDELVKSYEFMESEEWAERIEYEKEKFGEDRATRKEYIIQWNLETLVNVYNKIKELHGI